MEHYVDEFFAYLVDKHREEVLRILTPHLIAGEIKASENVVSMLDHLMATLDMKLKEKPDRK